MLALSSLLTLISNAHFNKVPTAQSSIDIVMEEQGTNEKGDGQIDI